MKNTLKICMSDIDMVNVCRRCFDVDHKGYIDTDDVCLFSKQKFDSQKFQWYQQMILEAIQPILDLPSKLDHVYGHIYYNIHLMMDRNICQTFRINPIRQLKKRI